MYYWLLIAGASCHIGNDDDDNDFIKHSGLPNRGILCGYKYKSSIFTDKSLEMRLFILQFRFVWESCFRLICPDRSQLQKGNLMVDFFSLSIHDTFVSFLHDRSSRLAIQPHLFHENCCFFCTRTICQNMLQVRHLPLSLHAFLDSSIYKL